MDLTVRERLGGIISQAVKAGACGAKEAWSMTPAELLLCVEALRERREERMREMDILAWLVGQYAAVGINAPGRYPARPDRIRQRARGDEEMRRMMEEMARAGK